MRYLADFVRKDLEKKMVFVAGPRQCGKTTFAKSILEKSGAGHYFNYDRDRDRVLLLKEKWSDTDKLLVFDELHKYPKWKNWLKGMYDTEKDKHQILVTGSARLNVYKKGGDSMAGRYHSWRLHPFSLSEIPSKITREQAFVKLMTVGGFPEPFLDGSETAARRWRKARFDQVIKDDIRDLENIKNINMLTLLIDLLKQRVGSLIVVANLAGDLQVSPITINRWIQALEKLYFIFVVRPFSKNVARSLQKPFKVFFYDNAEVDGDDGAKFENLVANHLLKKIEFLEDSTGYRYQLGFIRDREKREVDLVVIKENTLEYLVEVKLSDTQTSKNLLFFAERLNPKKAIQIVAHGNKSYKKNSFELQSALNSELLLSLS